ncbi:MAG: ABC transporter ATP-binding protein [Dorea sp.]|jgi:ABC-type lipoprotein export system ATPase subunit|nr:ABC transporter ATP-binding protein [Dorea sp.]
MELIRAENVVKNYQDTKVLKGISLTVQNGEFIGIMGKSGSGKTTLLKLMGMIEPATEGRMFYRENNIEQISGKEAARIRREELGFIFQEFFLMDSLNVLENVMLPLLIRKCADGSGKERAESFIKKFGIDGLEQKMPCELSGGERQRTAICRALINDPYIVLADEPTGNLDSKSGKVVIEALETINKELGKTVIMVTHDPRMASHCDRIILLKDGRVSGQMEKQSDTEEFYKEIIEKMIEL